MNELTDVWTLETSDEQEASIDLAFLADKALNGSRKTQNYLKKLWDESWQSIEAKLLITEDSSWYVWWMDGVRRHIANRWEDWLVMQKLGRMIVNDTETD